MASFLKNIVKSVGKYVQDAEKSVYGMDAPDAEVTIQGDTILVKAAPENEIEALSKGIFADEPDFGINLGRVGDLMDVISPDYDLTKMMQTIKANNEELFQRARRGSIPMEELIKMAEDLGADGIVAKFLKRKPGDVLPAEDIVGGLLMAKKLMIEFNAGLIRMDNLQGELREEAKTKLYVMAGLAENLLANVSGNVSEAARGLAVVRHAQKLAEVDLGESFKAMREFKESVDKGVFEYARTTYLALPKHARPKFARKVFAQKTWDAAMETYINALVSAPVTHIVNVAGNAIFQGLTLVERQVAGGIGAVRTLGGMRGSPDDRVYFGEAAAEAHGLLMSQGEAVALLTKTFVTGESPDLMSKIDMYAGTDKRMAIGSTDNIKQIYDMAARGDYSGFGVNLLGVATRMPGRFLATEDEYFKVISRRRVLHREAYRKSVQAFKAARMEGMSREDAKEFAAVEYADVIANPPDDVKEMVRQEALQMTFQDTPKGLFGTAEIAEPYANKLSVLQQGPGRIILPFLKTPMNVLNETVDRTINYYYVGAKALQKGQGREFDTALSKLAVGNAIFFTFAALASGYFGDDIVITGSGTNDPKAQKFRKAANIPDYSIGFKQPDDSYEFITYSRFDPISGVLAMAADYAAHARNAPDSENAIEGLYNMAAHGSLAAAEYATNMPYLQGVSEIIKAIQTPYDDMESKMERIARYLGKKSGDVAMTLGGSLLEPAAAPMRYFADIPALGSTPFQAAIERAIDPTARSTMLEEGEYFDPFSMSMVPAQDLPPYMKGFYQSYQYHKSRNISFSQEMEPELDFWGQEVTQGSGGIQAIVSPVQIQEGYYSDLNQEIERLSDIGAGTFSNHPKKIQANKSGLFDLDSKQYNQFIRNINEVDASGNLPGDTYYDPSSNLLSSLFEAKESEAYINAFDDQERYDILSNIVANRRLNAKKRLIASDPTLNALMGE